MKKIILLFFVLLGLDIQLCNAYGNGTLWPGKSIRLEVDASKGYFNPRWSVNNPTVSLTGSGFYRNVTADAYFGGSCTITCAYDYYVGSSKYDGKVTWEYDCADNSFTLSPTTMNMKVGDTKHLSWTFGWAVYIVPSMQFSGFDTSIIDVSPAGGITAKKEGSTTVYVSSNLGTNVAACVVNVSDAYVDPATISIPSEVSLVKGDAYQFLPTITPADNNASVTWTTDNADVASIDECGKLTANAAGVATVTARLGDGLAEAYCMVNVRNVDFELMANVAGGVIEKGSFIELSTGLLGAAIYYTTDGSHPMDNPTLYTGPICVEEPLLINAIAYHKDYGLSDLLTVSYDVTSLKVESCEPEQDAAEVRPDVTPTILFSDDIIKNQEDVITLKNVDTGNLVAFDYIIEGKELTIVPDEILDAGQYEIFIPEYAVVNGRGEPNGVISYKFKTVLAGSSGYADLQPYFRLMDDGRLYVWHKDFPNMNANDKSIEEHLALEDVSAVFGPWKSLTSNYSYIPQQYYYIDKDKQLWGWGSHKSSMGDENPIGNGSINDVSTPVKVLENVDDFKNGYDHKGALSVDGKLYLWGDGLYGKIGVGNYDDKTVPIAVLSNVECFDLGQYHSVAVTKDGKLWGWGYGEAIGMLTSQTTPKQIDDNVVYVCSGARHNLYVKNDKTLWSFGENNACIGANVSSSSDYVTPKQILTDVEMCYAGAYESLALKTNGDLYQWGLAAANTSYLLGETPTFVMQDVKDVQVVGWTVYVLKNDGTVWVRGNNDAGQLGLGHTTTDRDKAAVFHSPKIDNVEKIWASDWGCYALRSDGSLWGWGVGLPCAEGESTVPIELRPGVKHLEGIDIDIKDLELNIGEKKLLRVIPIPDDAVYASIEWISDNENVARVSNRGVVEGVNAGKTEITAIAKTEAGFTFRATSKVSVSMGTSVQSEELSPFNIKVVNGCLRVSGLLVDERVYVYDSSGLLSGMSCSKNGNVEIFLRNEGFYIVKTDKGKTAKIVVRS